MLLLLHDATLGICCLKIDSPTKITWFLSSTKALQTKLLIFHVDFQIPFLFLRVGEIRRGGLMFFEFPIEVAPKVSCKHFVKLC